MKLQTQPMVSVIMPVHNAGKFLRHAIESILAQTYKRFELIIVDDGSTDDSWSIIRNFKKQYPSVISCIRTKKQLNSAGNGATDLGLARAKGVFVARMDADDIARPKRLEKQVAYLTEHTDVILVGTQADIIDANGKTIGVKRVPLDHETIYAKYGVIHPIIHPSVMIRRSMLPNKDKLYLHKWGVNDDYYSFFKLLNFGKFANLEESLLKYRIHGKNLSLTGIKGKFFNTYHIRLEAIKQFRYQMPISSLIIMMAQAVVVSLIPNILLEKWYPVIRGMNKKPHIFLRDWAIHKATVAMSIPLVRRYQ
jgi:glycosyltransferase involved in cell wall biosynthesis